MGKRYEKVIDENLSFGRAMEELIDGKKITRSIWNGYWEIRESEFELIIVAELENGNKAPAMPYQSDMLAFDWMVVE